MTSDAKAASVPAVSIIIPAHNEEQVIGRCLSSLLAEAQPGEFEVLVVCNGCDDDTAAEAHRHGADVRVVTLPDPGKASALNAGDQLASSFPRLYVDADVTVSTAAVRATAQVLRDRGAMAAAPRLRVELADRPLAIRQYYAIWSRLPYVTDRLVGSGIVGLSEAGHARVGRFPDALSDDFYVHTRFSGAERCAVNESFTIFPPRSLADLVHRKTRSFAGLVQLRHDGHARSTQHSGAWLGVVGRQPALLPAVPVYVYVSLAARYRARRKVRSGAMQEWERDDSSRAPTPTR